MSADIEKLAKTLHNQGYNTKAAIEYLKSKFPDYHYDYLTNIYISIADNSVKEINPIIHDEEIECPICNAHMGINSTNCQNCGISFKSNQPKTKKDEDMCPNCKSEIVNSNNRFCDQCGFEINAPEPPKIKILMVCPICDSAYDESKKFCHKDGNKLKKKEID